jgi:hypothetical protein
MRASACWLLSLSLAVLGCGPARTQSALNKSASSDALTTSNGHEENGHEENGHEENGHEENGHEENGHQENGHQENGHQENGHQENGHQENGHQENGVDLGTVVSVELSPVVLTGPRLGLVLDASLQGSTLVGHSGRTAVSGADFVGALFVANVKGGLPAVLRVADHKYADAPNSDLDLYLVQRLSIDAHGSRWTSICADDDNNPTYASAVMGYWDYSQGTATGGSKINSNSRFTFSCTGGAIYKCTEWGYRPWATYQGVSLANYHQACTRMTRADYCGDGTSHTVDGSSFNIYDNLGIQTDTESWIFEAQWSPGGATCIAPGGVANNGAGVSCYAHLARSSCTADSPSAMLSTETPHGIRQP